MKLAITCFFIIKHIAVLLVFTLFRCHYTFLLGFLASTMFILSLDTNNTQRSKIEREVDERVVDPLPLMTYGLKLSLKA